MVVRGDIQVCLFLLPYAVYNAVAQGTEAAASDIMAEVEAVLEGGHASREGELCVQAVFSLLDVLKAWLEQRKRGAASSAQSAGAGVAGGQDTAHQSRAAHVDAASLSFVHEHEQQT